MIQIIPYEARHAAAFKALNLEWLEKYNLLEPLDQQVIDDPQGTILDKGGYIFLAQSENGQIVGTAALVLEHEGVYEFAKMSVAPALRGQGIGKALVAHCVEKARAIGAHKLELWSNSQLQTAINMYAKLGFQHVPVVNSPFVSADIKMELLLD